MCGKNPPKYDPGPGPKPQTPEASARKNYDRDFAASFASGGGRTGSDTVKRGQFSKATNPLGAGASESPYRPGSAADDFYKRNGPSPWNQNAKPWSQRRSKTTLGN